ncbi:BirA family biotin operon repressor/biotin-[acetyl-CoA-carboxylase] ligase [Yoonia maricola]|uniref:biotin--[biotin carboxyl-carrier protein] ligase n=1 Tax=Yoonia maricola TaxID=420999 RepID=A0A2M8WMT9_9RHOB|nr:biotin--[acetyl-CoA-carboxylase] ligase [Yoonia maricola]PJI92252.1 BirA family biotin operon repressor/biotin-[acetyl-CoA-carboxylase] ligase [Yoonia maricola]
MSIDPHDHGPWPEGYARIVLDTVDSTMAEAARRATDIDRPTWIMAKTQTAARGRRGRTWIVPEGNLNATLIFRPEATAAEAAKRSFLAANALYQALAIYVSVDKLSLKWPNDVLLSGGKVAGILLESSGQGPFVDWLSIGIGVNLAQTPEGVKDASFAPTSLSEAGGEAVSPKDFLSTLADAYATQEAKLLRFGFERIRDDWLANAARLGEMITARTARESVTGIFDSIDSDGNLVLITGTGPRAIPAADVFF